jgi:GTPase SAR1 family protein
MCLQRGGVLLCRFRSITQSYYRSAHALILVYDVSNQPTFDCCPDWLREIEEYASSKVRCDSNFFSTGLDYAVLSPIEVGSRSIAYNNKRL